jgi:hypothetical protein
MANATSCNDPHYNHLPNSVKATEVRDERGHIERHALYYRDEYCRVSRLEVLSVAGQLLAYVTYTYDDAGKNARTWDADVTMNTYAPDGTLLFQELSDGRRLDASGKPVDDCALLKLAKHMASSDRKAHEKLCHDAS